MKNSLVFLYGTISYFIGLGALMYMFGFMGNLSFLPKTIDSGVQGPLTVSILINAALIALFGIQHAIMARDKFKKMITQFIPPAAERSTFVLMTGIVLTIIMWQWRSIPTTIWSVENGSVQLALTIIFWSGWGLVVLSSFLINHFELFGLQQIWLNLVDKPEKKDSFKMPVIYKNVRHPIMLGVIIGIWVTPHMTVGHLLFSLLMTTYILIGIKMEENDLISDHGEKYLKYKEQVPALIPFLHKKN